MVICTVAGSAILIQDTGKYRILKMVMINNRHSTNYTTGMHPYLQLKNLATHKYGNRRDGRTQLFQFHSIITTRQYHGNMV